MTQWTMTKKWFYCVHPWKSPRNNCAWKFTIFVLNKVKISSKLLKNSMHEKLELFPNFNATKHFHYSVIYASFFFHEPQNTLIEKYRYRFFFSCNIIAHCTFSIDFLPLTTTFFTCMMETFLSWLLIATLPLSLSPACWRLFHPLSLHFSCQKFVWIVARLNFMFE